MPGLALFALCVPFIGFVIGVVAHFIIKSMRSRRNERAWHTSQIEEFDDDWVDL
jgi:hypothetical protein